MLRFLREKGNSWFLKGLLAVVALTFVSWGGYSMTAGRRAVPGGRVAAWVNDTPITVREFEFRYFQQSEAMRRQFGGSFTPEIEQQMGLRRVTLNQLISEKLQIKEAERLGIQVTDEEVALRIQQIPHFQRDGRFDPEVYQGVLRSNRLNPRQFEDQQRLAIAIDNLRRYIGLGASVSRREIRAAYIWLNEKVRLEYISIPPGLFSKNVTVSDEVLKTHYEKNKNLFRVGARRKAAWWYIPFDVVGKGIAFELSELKKHYKETISRYAQKEEVTLEQILIKVPPDAEKQKVDQTREKLTNIRKQILEGKSFGEMAKQHSEGPEAAEGGKLGTFGRKQMIPELEEVAFSLKEGEVSMPTRSQFGIHLLKVVKHQRPEVLPFEKVRSEVEKSLRQARAREEAKRILRAVRYNLEDKKQPPRAEGLQSGVSNFFEKRLPPLTVPEREIFSELVFDLKVKNEFSKEESGEKGVMFVQFLDTREPEIPDFDDVKDRVRASYLAAEGREIAKRKSDEWLEEIKENKKTFKSLADEMNVSLSNPEAFSRDGIPEELGKGVQVSRKLFGLKKGEVGTITSGDNVIFVRLIEKIPADLSKLEEEKSDLRQRILDQKRNLLFRQRMEQAQKSAKIRLEEGFSL